MPAFKQIKSLIHTVTFGSAITFPQNFKGRNLKLATQEHKTVSPEELAKKSE